MKIIVYTGSFNPVSKGHLNIIEKLSNLEEVKKVFVVPVGDFYNKKGLESSKHRINMLRKFESPIIEISEIETSNKKQLRTIETLRIIKEKYPLDDIYLVLGSDNLVAINTWYKWEELIRDYKLLVVHRKGYKPLNDIINDLAYLKEFKSNLSEISIDCNFVSSTKIRELFRDNKLEELKKYAPSSTIEYISKYNLYKNV